MGDLILDAPVGTDEERAGAKLWPGAWIDATGYLTHYNATGAWAYHTGVDLNLNQPHWDADRLAPCYAIGDGIVVAARDYAVWGPIVVVRHRLGDDVPDVFYARYAHLNDWGVRAGQVVTRGQELGHIGNAHGRYAYHLHFDLPILDAEHNPTSWPGDNLQRARREYLDPLAFILAHHPVSPVAPTQPEDRIVTAEPTLRVRSAASLLADVVGQLPTGTVIEVIETSGEWGRIAAPVAGWVMLKWTRPYPHPNPPPR